MPTEGRLWALEALEALGVWGDLCYWKSGRFQIRTPLRSDIILLVVTPHSASPLE